MLLDLIVKFGVGFVDESVAKRYRSVSRWLV